MVAGNLVLKMKLTKLLNELSPKQQMSTSETLDLVIKSNEERKK